MKWAEEGYAVVGVRHGLKKEGEVVQALKLSLDALKAHETCSTKDKFAVFGEHAIQQGVLESQGTDLPRPSKQQRGSVAGISEV